MPSLRTLIFGLIGLAIIAGGAFWLLTMPQRLAGDQIAEAADGAVARGERIFWIGGCASCHARPKAEGDARLELAGGLELATPFGTFVAPNISSDETDGIGGWSLPQFANAVQRGVSPEGRHYYPAFPYASYERMKSQDVADLYAFMRTLPAVQGKAPPHKIGFPFNVRRGLGLWKRLFLHPQPVIALAGDASGAVRRGQYLVEGPGHCGECHTPRNPIGGTQYGKWLSGAAAPTGKGKIPNITPGGGDVGEWSQDEIAEYLESGFTPEFDSAGGEMASVVENLANLPAEDRAAIAAYLKAIPALPNGY